ncbi:MAG: DNA recombination/repair protein RecA, partial [Candidatus Polarisedimenticolia bacterium]
VAHKIIEKSGAWLSYNGERLGQGRENARQFLKDNRDKAKELDYKLREKLGLLPKAAEETAAEPVEDVVPATQVADRPRRR